MGKPKRKNASPLMNDVTKNRRTGDDEETDVELLEENGTAQSGPDEAAIAGLKTFIRRENQESRKNITEEIKRYNEERMAALENSLTFALTVNETLSKRLTAVEKRAEQAEQDFFQCAKRICEVEDELDNMRQSKLLDWLIFSGPTIPRRLRNGRPGENGAQMLSAMLEQLLDFRVDMQQISEVHREERQLRVRFTYSRPGSDRDILFRNKTRLRGTGLFIRESLTPKRQGMFNELVAKKRDKKIVTVFTRSGTVFAVVNQGERPRPVRSDDALQRLLNYMDDVSGTAPATGPPHGDAPASTATNQGEQIHQSASSASPASQDVGMPTPSSSGSQRDAEGLLQDGHLAAGHVTTASDIGRARREPSEETQRSPPAAGTSRTVTSTVSRTAVSAHQENDNRLPDYSGVGADRSASPGLRPVTREQTPGRRGPVREPERRPVARSDGRLGGGPTTTSLRRRHGADIRQFLGASREHSKRD